MRLLILNPNTSRGVTDRIREAAEAAAMPGDAFTTTRPAFGPKLIVTDADAEEAKRAVIDTVRNYTAPCDGIVLASFGNTGAEEVRALRADIPVIGIASAAFATARALGGPFGIVTFGAGLVEGLRAKAEEAGLGAALIGISHVPVADFGDPGTVQHRFRAELAALCAQMHAKGAASIVMGGGPLAGLAPVLARDCPVPVIDGTRAAINLIRSVAVDHAEGAARRSGASGRG
ncbi:Asp/Glu/hydantoin racemase [Roseivivax lentus]|uniref:Asp/Glu/hydantoin racemase n=1 Tax=Roseivivax lentus TaxID=633194 RepID=A0A1N7KST3_9RHOB|nr:aspartate/glutamate racemase family protein [Roseivivax lentus]SIS64624.1 Asp/Glu/hydantoin racemase [Roseivivax lentus]